MLNSRTNYDKFLTIIDQDLINKIKELIYKHTENHIKEYDKLPSAKNMLVYLLSHYVDRLVASFSPVFFNNPFKNIYNIGREHVDFCNTLREKMIDPNSDVNILKEMDDYFSNGVSLNSKGELFSMLLVYFYYYKSCFSGWKNYPQLTNQVISHIAYYHQFIERCHISSLITELKNDILMNRESSFYVANLESFPVPIETMDEIISTLIDFLNSRVKYFQNEKQDFFSDIDVNLISNISYLLIKLLQKKPSQELDSLVIDLLLKIIECKESCALQALSMMKIPESKSDIVMDAMRHAMSHKSIHMKDKKYYIWRIIENAIGSNSSFRNDYVKAQLDIISNYPNSEKSDNALMHLYEVTDATETERNFINAVVELILCSGRVNPILLLPKNKIPEKHTNFFINAYCENISSDNIESCCHLLQKLAVPCSAMSKIEDPLLFEFDCANDKTIKFTICQTLAGLPISQKTSNKIFDYCLESINDNIYYYRYNASSVLINMNLTSEQFSKVVGRIFLALNSNEKIDNCDLDKYLNLLVTFQEKLSREDVIAIRIRLENMITRSSVPNAITIVTYFPQLEISSRLEKYMLLKAVTSELPSELHQKIYRHMS